MHVEVRKPGDYLRASNNMRLIPNIEWSRLPSGKTLELECQVEETNKRYSLLTSDYHTCANVKGFALDNGFLDGYISHSSDGFFGIVKPHGFFHPMVSLEIKKDNSEIKCNGIAFCLSFREPRIKVIPLKYGDGQLCVGDKVQIKIEVR